MPALAYIGLVVYAVIDCLQTPSDEIQRLSRPGWLMVIVLIPLFGAVGWLLAGQTGGLRRHARAPSGPEQADGYGWTVEGVAHYPIGPDDDPEFLASLATLSRTQNEQRLLTRQEEDRRRREQQRPQNNPDGPDQDRG